MSGLYRHFHWVFMAFDHESPETAEKVLWPVEVTVLGFTTESDAAEAASGIVHRQHYKLQRVYECNTCRFQSEQVEAIRDMTDAMK